ncbi:TetR family transcriptional regulator [Dictyobacter arantiisoli]|uniref:TetR family transcriptional regulator n=2 Tax=Dictyobacter arantiisoli TaxID=2014874 RepID=A0A5A5TCB9_9CHLR|nr:TetR family transcriptional regulator [Dictyobacter arantiisoli]
MRKNQDIRARFTRKLLQDTLIALLAEKRFEMITVGEIAERAMVNRATFYRHYQDKYALGNSLFQEAIDQLTCDLSSPLKSPSASEVEGVITLLAASFTHIAEYSRLYRVMVMNAWFTTKMHDTLAELLSKRLRLPPSSSQNAVEGMPEEIAVASLANWFISMIRWWLENGMPYSPRQMALWCTTFISSGLFQAMGIPLPH